MESRAALSSVARFTPELVRSKWQSPALAGDTAWTQAALRAVPPLKAMRERNARFSSLPGAPMTKVLMPTSPAFCTVVVTKPSC